MNKSKKEKEKGNAGKAFSFKRMKMIDWYSPTQLAATGLRSVISSIFGNYADKREMQAALTKNQEKLDHFDFSDREELWIDYVSDLGSGWNSTYSVAYLLGRKELGVGDRHGNIHQLKRGNILVMGGDEVYPTPNAQEYNNRLVGPYTTSLSQVDEEDDPPSLFAIPGNHDWYDGLSSFIKLFCQQRWIGGWKTKQTRSYFAAKLPYNWWLWGIDIQLSEDLDKPQIDYFDEMNDRAAPGDRIILCTSEPVWAYQEYQPDDKPYRNLKFFTERYTKKKEKKLDFRLMLTGDMHHYTSFKNINKTNPDWKITAGGGGAFTHPTHHIPDRLHLEKGEYEKSESFPNKKESRRIARRNIKFPFINLKFGAFFAGLYVIFGWFISTSSVSASFGESSFFNVLAAAGIGSACRSLVSLFLGSPGLSLFVIVLFSGIYAFTDTNRKKPVSSRIAGFIHGVVQVVLLLAAVWATSCIVVNTADLTVTSATGIALSALLLGLFGWLLSGFAMGLYLMSTTLLLKIHETEAFSSLRGEDYKNFIRMHLSSEGLTLFPVKIPKACRRWREEENKKKGQEPWYKPEFEDDLKFELIEGPLNIN